MSDNAAIRIMKVVPVTDLRKTHTFYAQLYAIPTEPFAPRCGPSGLILPSTDILFWEHPNVTRSGVIPLPSNDGRALYKRAQTMEASTIDGYILDPDRHRCDPFPTRLEFRCANIQATADFYARLECTTVETPEGDPTALMADFAWIQLLRGEDPGNELDLEIRLRPNLWRSVLTNLGRPPTDEPPLHLTDPDGRRILLIRSPY